MMWHVGIGGVKHGFFTTPLQNLISFKNYLFFIIYICKPKLFFYFLIIFFFFFFSHWSDWNNFLSRPSFCPSCISGFSYDLVQQIMKYSFQQPGTDLQQGKGAIPLPTPPPQKKKKASIYVYLYMCVLKFFIFVLIAPPPPKIKKKWYTNAI